MKKYLKSARPILACMLCASAAMFAVNALLRNLSALFQQIGPLLGFHSRDISQIGSALAQLKDAHIVSPWLPLLLSGAVLGGLFGWIFRARKHRTVIGVCLWILLLILMLPAALLLTEVNGVRIVALLKSLLPLLPALL